MIRSVPNSCTSPTRVLKGCPASATSSPMRKTRGSRRISSAMASLTASPYVSSRALRRISSSTTLFDDAVGPDQDRLRDGQAQLLDPHVGLAHVGHPADSRRPGRAL